MWEDKVSFNETQKSAKNILFKRIYNLYIINADILLIFILIFVWLPILLHSMIAWNHI